MDSLSELAAKFNSLKDPFLKSQFLLEVQKKGVPLKDIASVLGVNVSYLSHLKRLKKLPEMLIDGYYAGSISLSHLFVISRLKKKEDMVKLYEKVLKENLSVQETESEIRNLLYKIRGESGYYFPSDKKEKIKDLFKRFLSKEMEIRIIQTRVKIKVILEGKGNLKATTKILVRLLKLLKDINVKNLVDF